jgi:hypothetical protein
LNKFQGHYAKCERLISKGYIVYDSNYLTFRHWKNLKLAKRLAVIGIRDVGGWG